MNKTFSEIWEIPMVQRATWILLGIIIIFLVAGMIKKTLQKKVKDPGTKYKASKATSFISYLLFVILLLFVFRDKIGSVGVALGVAGAGIAFALQEVIVSFAGWLNILVSGVVNVGDRVKIGAVKGDIIDIGVLSSTIMEVGDWVNGDLYNGRIVTVANSFIFKESVHNYSSEFPFLWDEVIIPITNDSDYHLARKIFEEVLQDICGEYASQSEKKWTGLTNHYKVEAAQVQPMVSLSFNENWISFNLRYAVNYKKRRVTKDLIFTRILDEIRKHEDVIMIGRSTLEVTNVAPDDEDSENPI